MLTSRSQAYIYRLDLVAHILTAFILSTPSRRVGSVDATRKVDPDDCLVMYEHASRNTMKRNVTPLQKERAAQTRWTMSSSQHHHIFFMTVSDVHHPLL
jgi:hypothetical protein